MVSKDHPIHYQFIDRNIRGLVRFLNTLPNMRTMSSCGGHKNPTEIQHAEGTWFVGIWLYKAGRATVLPLLQRFCECREGVKLDRHVSLRRGDHVEYDDRMVYLCGEGVTPKDTLKALTKFVRAQRKPATKRR